MSLKGKRIFIVEDNAGNKAIAQMLLERQGAVVITARWPQEVIDRLQKAAPVDLILMDLMLPDNVSGYDLFDAIRLLPEFAHVPIVAVSAADPSLALPKTRERGFSGFISKPIAFKLFVQQMEQSIAGDHIWYTA